MIVKTDRFGGVSLGDPRARTGHQPSGAINYRIIDVPADVESDEVLSRFRQSAPLSGHVHRYQALGPGRILRGVGR